MKKLTILFFCVATLSLASCKKQTVLQPATTAPNRTIIFDKSANSWQPLPNKPGQYYVDLNAAEIDNINVQDEGVLVYISVDGATATGYFQIPNSQQSYDYDIYPGYIRIYSYITPPTTSTRIKVVLIAAENVT